MIRVNKRAHVVKTLDTETGLVVLECPTFHTELRFSVSELAQMRIGGQLELVHEPPPSYEPRGTPHLRPLSEAQRLVIQRRIAYGKALAALGRIGPQNKVFLETLANVAARLKDPHPPSPFSAYRWCKRFLESGGNTAVFLHEAMSYRMREPRIDPRAKSVLQGHIQSLLGKFVGATLYGITDLALALTARDLGYVRFTSKHGTEHCVEEFIPTAEALLAQQRHRRKRRKPIPSQPSNVLEEAV
jgi:hypothetical protein